MKTVDPKGDGGPFDGRLTRILLLAVIVFMLVLMSCGIGDHDTGRGQESGAYTACAVSLIDIGFLALISIVILLRKKIHYLFFIGVFFILLVLSCGALFSTQNTELHKKAVQGEPLPDSTR